MSGIQNCVGCGSRAPGSFYQARNVPVLIGRLWTTRRDAINCQKGDITLALCQDCGLITNTSYDPSLLDYSQEYDNSLDFSTVFQEYARALVQRLVERHKLYHKRIVEIGCGNGQFLSALCELGDNQGVGYDPSHDPSGNTNGCSSRVRIVPEVYSPQDDDSPVDFLCCRHVLEHIPAPRSFLTCLQQKIAKTPGAGMFFEVPNMMHTLCGASVWTIIYEHCTYYCTTALARIFEVAGFQVSAVSEEYGSQFLSIEACSCNTSRRDGFHDSDSIRKIAESATVFRKRIDEKRDSLHNTLRRAHARRTPVVLWGAGARAVSFVNSLDDASLVHSAVDLNPSKHGKFIAGTGHEIVPPESLPRIRPGVIVVMNPIYAQEIAEARDSLGLDSELVLA